jgi:DNA-binding transcriptional regulator YiaG
MPNIATALRAEISRLSRKEIREQVEPTRKATAQHRRDIASLKRQVASLEREVKALARRAPAAAASAPEGGPARMRFVAKGLRSLRSRLDLSAADFGRLLGVSAQSIYNWEGGSTVPRGAQLQRLAQVRTLGKRDAQRLLEQAARTAPRAKK